MIFRGIITRKLAAGLLSVLSSPEGNGDTRYGIRIKVEEIGIPEMRFHDLRHSYATLALQNGVDVKTVSSNLGHATTAFTMDRYGHVTETMLKDSADTMQRFIESL